MSRRAIVALVLGGCFVCIVGLVGVIGLLRFAGDRRGANREQERARAALALAPDRQQNAERIAAPIVDWAEVAAAYTNSDPTPDEVAEFAPLFDELGRALAREDAAAADRFCDLDRVLDEVIAVSGWRADTPAQTRAELAPDFRGGFARWMVQNKGLRWTHTDVRRVVWQGGRSEATVYVVHRTATGDSFKTLWWVVQRPDGWRVFDTADLFIAARFTREPVTTNAPEVLQLAVLEPGRYAVVRDALVRATRALDNGANVVVADEALESARGLRLPPEDAALVAILEGRILSHQNDIDAALLQFETADRLVPGMPAAQSYRATALNRAGRYEEALSAAHEYQRRCGPDCHVFVIEGFALEGLARDREATAVYRRALDDDPDSADALRGLGRMLPAGKKDELGARLAKARNPRRLYDQMVWGMGDRRDEVVAELLLNALRKAKPDDPRGLAEDIRRQIKAGRFDAAQALMEHGLKAPSREDREEVLDSYLFAMSRAKKRKDAYATVPQAHAAHAFRTLAEERDDVLGERDDEPDTVIADLRELIAAHRERAPGDPWLWFFEGAIHRRQKEFDKAAEAFAAGAKRLPPAKAKPGPNEWDENAGAVNQFRSRRVECMFQAKKGLEAYEKIEPTAEVFQELAGLYDHADDLDGLAALIAAHHKREPADPQRLYWQGHLSYRDRNYAAAALQFKTFLLETDARAANRWSARDEYLRSTLRMDPAAAGRLLAEFGREPVAFPLRAAIAAAIGDRDELERLIAEATRNGNKLWFYTDEDFRAAIRHEQWADLRARHPNPNPPKR
ncbi:MAG TPA: hypothetical protein VGE74_02620 [Gemmata sp.]